MRKWKKFFNVKCHHLGLQSRGNGIWYNSYDSLICMFWIFGSKPKGEEITKVTYVVFLFIFRHFLGDQMVAG